MATSSQEPNVNPAPAPVLFIPPYDGQSNFQEWCLRFKRIATCCAWPENMWPVYASAYFKGTADHIWYSLPEEEVPDNWDDFISTMEQFFDNEDVNEIEYQLLQRKQGDDEPYTLYSQDIQALTRRLGRPVGETELLRLIIRGLKPRLIEHIYHRELSTLKELDKAVKLCEEAQLLAKRNIRQRSQAKQSTETTPVSTNSNTVLCSNMTLPRRSEIMRSADGRPICFLCARVGHVARYCRQPDAAKKTLLPVSNDQGYTAVKQVPVGLNSFVSSDLLKFECLVNDFPATAILDTGAGMTAINSVFAKTIGIIPHTNSDVSVRVVGGQVLNGIKTANITLKVNDTPQSWNTMIVPDLPADVLIGVDWCRRNKVLLNFGADDVLKFQTKEEDNNLDSFPMLGVDRPKPAGIRDPAFVLSGTDSCQRGSCATNIVMRDIPNIPPCSPRRQFDAILPRVSSSADDISSSGRQSGETPSDPRFSIRDSRQLPKFQNPNDDIFDISPLFDDVGTLANQPAWRSKGEEPKETEPRYPTRIGRPEGRIRTPQPPTTQPPLLQSLTTQPSTTQPSLVQPPTTQPPLVQPPTTQPPLLQPPIPKPPTAEPPIPEQPAAEPSAGYPRYTEVLPSTPQTMKTTF